MKTVKEMNSEQFKAALAEEKPLVCDFWASWCMPCRMLAPVMEKLSGEFSSRATFAKVNIDDNGELAEKYGIMSIPNVLVFKQGKPTAQQIGFVSENAMRTFLEENV